MPVKIEKIPMTKMAKENEKLWKVDYEKVEKAAVTAVTAVTAEEMVMEGAGSQIYTRTRMPDHFLHSDTRIFPESQWRRERYRLAAFSQPFLSNL
jgi:hypothetical protein